MWIDLESIMLSEISQTEKDKYCIIHTWNQKSQTHRNREWNGSNQSLGRWGDVGQGYKLSM